MYTLMCLFACSRNVIDLVYVYTDLYVLHIHAIELGWNCPCSARASAVAKSPSSCQALKDLGLLGHRPGFL